MLSIGEFARQGRVSARMLRHYDALGLLTPAHVDRVTGYRSYAAAQLSRLNRIVALKDLGFTLPQVRSILDEKVSGEQLRGMLRLRRAELSAQIAVDNARLTQVEARLQIIEREGTMPTDDVQIKRIPAVRVAQLTAIADSFEPESIGPVLGPLYLRLLCQLETAGLTPAGPHLAYYRGAGAGDAVIVHACVPVDAWPSPDHPFAIVDLPAIERAATIIHRGPMDGVVATIQTLAWWIERNGYRSTGYNRELYLHYGYGDDPTAWTTELQEPIVADTEPSPA
jgi:DNA-binding transcriptional MerR regulator